MSDASGEVTQNPGTIAAIRRQAGTELATAVDKIPFRSAHFWILVLVASGGLFDAVEQYNVGLAAPQIAAQWNLDNTQVGLLTTLTFIGMSVGSLIAGITGDKYGRKFTYMYNLLLFTLGALLAAFAPNVGVLLIARFIVGIGLGGELNTGLTLVAEIMPTKVRGAAVATINVAAGGFGIFVASLLASIMLGPLEGVLGGPTLAWRWMFGILVLPALLVFFYRLFLPESPRYLLSAGKVREVNGVLTRLAANRLRIRQEQQVTPYVQLPEGTQLPAEKVRLGDIFRGGLARRTVIIWVVSAMTFGAQVTSTVFLPTVLVARGFDIDSSLVYTTVINVGGLIGAILSSAFGYKFKRRIVLGYGSGVAVLVAILFAVSGQLSLVLIFGGLLQLMFILLNTTTWVWAPELYPTRVRAFGTGASVTVALLSASFFPLLAGRLNDVVGTVGMFVMIAVMYAIMVVAVYLGPETHGTSLEDMDNEAPARP